MIRSAKLLRVGIMRMPSIVAIPVGLLIGWLLVQVASNIDLIVDAPWNDFRSVAKVKGIATDLEFTPDGRQLVVGTMGDGAQLLRFPEGDVLSTFDEGMVFHLALSPDGQLLATRSDDHETLNLWRISDRELLQSVESDTGWIMGIKFSPDGSVLAVATSHGTSLWSVAEGGSLTLMRRLSVGDRGDGLSFSPDGRLLAVGSASEVRLWRLADGKLLHTFPGHSMDIALSPDGRWLAVPESAYSNNVGLWDVVDGKKIRSLTSEVPISSSQQVHSLAVSPDGSLLATGNMDTRVRIWRTSDGTLIDTPDLGSGNTAESITFSPDSSSLVAGTYGRVKMRTIEVRP